MCGQRNEVAFAQASIESRAVRGRGASCFRRLARQEAAEVPPTKGEEKHSGCRGPEGDPCSTHTKIIVDDLAWLWGSLQGAHGIQ